MAGSNLEVGFTFPFDTEKCGPDFVFSSGARRRTLAVDTSIMLPILVRFPLRCWFGIAGACGVRGMDTKPGESER
jgi:hypothetical protein